VEGLINLYQQENLDAITAEVTACTKCILWKSRKNVVPGEGNVQAKIMFIGEAPGYWEDVKGKPFVGDAGKFLDSLISSLGLTRNDVFIGNILKCRPPRNREPSQIEIQTCTPYLDRQIKAIKPKIVVTLGNHSTSYIFSKVGLPFSSMTQVHGKFHETSFSGMQILVFSTFHPAAALYNPKYKQQIIQDFQLLKQELAKRSLTS